MNATMPMLIAACFAGFALSVIKQLRDAKAAGAVLDSKFVKAYFIEHWLDSVFALLGTIVLFVLGREAGGFGVMDAVLAGYTGNSIADLLSGPLGRRSLLIANQVPPKP